MGQRAKAGTCLASLVKMAVPLCQRAERACPRTGPGRKPEIPDWVMAILIMIAVLKRKKGRRAGIGSKGIFDVSNMPECPRCFRPTNYESIRFE